MSQEKDIDLVVKAQIKQAHSQMEKLKDDYKELMKLQDKFYEKGRKNNYTLSARDKSNLSSSAGEVRRDLKNTNSLSDYYSDNKNAFQGADSALLRELESSFKSLESTIKEKASSLNYNPKTSSIYPGTKFSKIQEFNTSDSRAFSQPFSADERRKVNAEDSDRKSQISDLRSQINNLRGSSYRTSNRIDTSINSGSMSYERYQEYLSSIKASRHRLKDYNKNLKAKRNDFNRQQGYYQNKVDSISSKEKAGLYSPGDMDNVNAQKQAYQKQVQSIQKSIDQLDKLSQSLKTANKNINGSSQNLNTAVNGDSSTGQDATVQVGLDKNTVLGRLYNRRDSLLMHAGASVAAGISSTMSQGASIRTQNESNINPLMIGLANSTGTVSKGMDNTILNNLAKRGLNNGTNYTGSQMAQFAAAYSSSTGNTRNYLSSADYWSQLSRYSGMGQQTTEQVMEAAGQAGSGDTSSLARTIQGELVNSNMTAKAGVQGQALTSLYNTYSQYGISRATANRMAAFQGVMAKEGSTMQGQNGVNAYEGTSSAVTNYNDPVSRMLFGGNSAKYAGIDGQYKLMEDMQDAKSDPSKWRTPIGNALKMAGGDKLKAAGTLAQMSQEAGGNLTIKNAKKMLDLYQKGDLSKSKLDSLVNGDKTTKGKGKSAYSSSGTSTLDEKTSILENASTHLSQSFDSLRSSVNKLGKSMSQTGTGSTAIGLSTGLGSGIGSMVGTVGGNIISGLLGGRGLGARALEGVTGAKIADKGLTGIFDIGSKLSSKGGLIGKLGDFVMGGATVATGLGTKLKGAGAKVIGKGTELFGIGKDAVKGSKFGSKAIDIGSKVLDKGSGILSAGKDIIKGSSIGSKILGVGGKLLSNPLVDKIGLKGAAKIGGKLLGPIGLAWTAADAIHGAYNTVRHPVESLEHPFRTVGNWLGLSESADDYMKQHHQGQYAKKTSDKQRDDKKEKNNYDNSRDVIKGFNDMLDKAEKVIKEAKALTNNDSASADSTSDNTSANGNTSESYWKKQIEKAAKASGVNLSSSEENAIWKRIQKESNGDETVTQKISDENSAKGTPAQGLLQYVPSTFKHYAVSGHTNIKSGYDQLLAMFNDSNWASDISGSSGWGPSGSTVKHAVGGMFNSSGLSAYSTPHIIGDRGLEVAVPLSDRTNGKNALQELAGNFGQKVVSVADNNNSHTSNKVSMAPSYSINVTGGSSSASEIAAAVKSQVSQAQSDLANKLLNYFSYNRTSMS